MQDTYERAFFSPFGDDDYALRYSFDLMIDSCFIYHYPIRDTIGSQRRFERALCPQFQQAIKHYSDFSDGDNMIVVFLLTTTKIIYSSRKLSWS